MTSTGGPKLSALFKTLRLEVPLLVCLSPLSKVMNIMYLLTYVTIALVNLVFAFKCHQAHLYNHNNICFCFFITAMGILKKCCAKMNNAQGKLDTKLCDVIVKATDEVIAGRVACLTKE